MLSIKAFFKRICFPQEDTKIRIQQTNIEKIINKDCIDYDLVNTLGEECIICLNTLEKNHKATLLKCGHVYHSHCIYSWFMKKKVCPICDIEIKKI